MSQKLLFSCGFSKSLQPFFGAHPNAKSVSSIQILGSTRIGYGRIKALVKDESGSVSVDGGILPKEFEFKPSFDEYLKAMESVRTSRGKKHEHGVSRLGSKNGPAKKKGALKGSEKSEPHEKRKKLVENKTDLEQDESSGIEEDWLWHSDVEERTSGLNSGRTLNFMQSSEEDSNEEQEYGLGSSNGYDKLRDNSKEAEEIFDKKLNLQKMRMAKVQKGAKCRVIDTEFVEERVAFRNYDVANDVAEKRPVSRMEMEQRIQMLAQGLVFFFFNAF